MDNVTYTNTPTATKGQVMESRFDDFGGHYSVLVDGIEFARFAPSPLWSEFWNDNAQVNWTYKWVAN